MAEDIKTENPVTEEKTETDKSIAEDVKTEETEAKKDEAGDADGSSADGEKKNAFWNENKVEVIVAILLGVTALLTAWASWIGSLHGGIQSINFTKSNNASSEASSAYNLGIQMFLSDILTWNTIMDYSFELALAETDNDQEKIDLITEKLKTYADQNASDILREGLRWMEENEEDNPFNMPNITEKYFEEAKGKFEEAQELLKEGKNDNARGDAYNLVTVLFSMVLFLLGIVGVFKRLPNRIGVLLIASVILVGATIYMLTIPLPTGFDLWSYIGLK